MWRTVDLLRLNTVIGVACLKDQLVRPQFQLSCHIGYARVGCDRRKSSPFLQEEKQGQTPNGMQNPAHKCFVFRQSGLRFCGTLQYRTTLSSVHILTCLFYFHLFSIELILRNIPTSAEHWVLITAISSSLFIYSLWKKNDCLVNCRSCCPVAFTTRNIDEVINLQ